MSRASRTARGAFGALAATLLAAASHSLAGGTVTPLAVLATAVLALPLCVLLAGRAGSLWRLALAVASAQFAYHWLFAGIGSAQLRGSALTSGGLAVSPHADHLGLASFAFVAPGVVESGAADAWMWGAHALAAALTIALMHRGERAALRLARALRDTVAVRLPAEARLPQRPAILALFNHAAPRARQSFLTEISRRGPPTVSFSRA